jgi:uncharacterized protein (DUF1800 family)
MELFRELPSSPPNPPIWKRPVSRRTVLATAAAGGTAAVLAALWGSGELSQIQQRIEDATHGYKGALTDPRTRMAHLLRRAGFGATSAELDHYTAMGTGKATDAILDYQNTSNAALEAQLPPIDPTQVGRPAVLAAQIQAWWLQRMVLTARPLEEKMTLFWHSLLTSGLDKSGPGQLYVQNQLYRTHALGNFDDLMKAVSRDPAMMVYLDTETNRVGKPNENYARELMELFTTGIGHYTEDDVRESARAFTGWTLVRNGGNLRYATQSRFVPRLHDDGVKTFMGKTGNFTGDDIVEMLVPMRATAERLSTRLFTFFAYPNPEKAIVQHLADTFQKNRYNVGAVVKEIFTMDAFYSDRAYRSLIKSPAELVAQAIRSTGSGTGLGENALRAAVAGMSSMGQVLFYPPNVAGWPGGTSWLNGATLLTRLNFTSALATRAQADWSGKGLDAILSTFVDGNITTATRQALTQIAPDHAAATVLAFTLATPEYQLN